MKTILIASILFSACLELCFPCHAIAQENSDFAEKPERTIPETIIIETGRKPPEPKPLYAVKSAANASLSETSITQDLVVDIKVIQGKLKVATLELRGAGEVTNVTGDGVKSWGIRRESDVRLLDIYLQDERQEVQAAVAIRTAIKQLPASAELLHLAAGDAIGFSSTIELNPDPSIEHKVMIAEGFANLQSLNGVLLLQSNTGGRIIVEILRATTAPANIELIDAALSGTLSPDGKSMTWKLTCTVIVNAPGAEIEILAGNAAVSELPQTADYRLTLSMRGEQPSYSLRFPSTGSFPVNLDFVAPVTTVDGGINRIDFMLAASAIVPLKLEGFPREISFLSSPNAIVPQLREANWLAFLPATGRMFFEWKPIQRTAEGKLFFTTNGRVEALLGSGLLKQEHLLNYQILQGELSSLEIELVGPGEILDVQGAKVLAWNIVQQGDRRMLSVALSQPFTGNDSITVRSQTALGAFPVRVEGISLQPTDSLRHSGFLRITNDGLVRIEPVGLTGLAQLSPDQFPGEAREARQVFVYRFPAASYAFAIAADRIQPEVNVSELTTYQLTDTDRRISADIELDIREAPIREWQFLVPEDYSVVAVTGASVSDYVVGTTVTDSQRSLTVIFSQDVLGRQLVNISLEKSEQATAGQWPLLRISHPQAKTVRGDIGVVGTPGFRLGVVSAEKLLEKPVSYFPKSTPYLQHAFRLRESDWSATLQIELLERSIQADTFHLYSLSEQTIYGSAILNFFVTGSPVSEWTITVPQSLVNVTIDGLDVRTWRREGDNLIVALHQGVMGAYTLLVTFEQKPDRATGGFSAGLVTASGVQSERGFVQIVSPLQVELTVATISDAMLQLDALELPAEFRLLSSAPSLGTWQYTERPFQLDLEVKSFRPGSTVTQVVEFSEARSRVSKDGELVTDVVYYLKSRGERTLRVNLPSDPVRLWEVSVNGQPVTARQAADATLIPLPGDADPNVPVEVRLRLGKPSSIDPNVSIDLPVLPVAVLKTQWQIEGDEQRVLVPSGGSVAPSEPPLRPSGWEWIVRHGLILMILVSMLTAVGAWGTRSTGALFALGLLASAGAVWFSFLATFAAYNDLRGFEPIQLSLPVMVAGESLQVIVQSQPLWLAYISWSGVIVAAVGLAILALSFAKVGIRSQSLLRIGGLLALVCGVLAQRDSAPWFFAGITSLVLLFLLLPAVWRTLNRIVAWSQVSKDQASKDAGDGTGQRELNAATSVLVFVLLAYAGTGVTVANEWPAFKAADRLQQDWEISSESQRLTVSGTVQISGLPGDQFKLLASPATMTRFDGRGLKLSKHQSTDEYVVYVVTIQAQEVVEQPAEEAEAAIKTFEATFEYYLDAVKPLAGIPVPTGSAAVHNITLTYDRAGLEVACEEAVRIEQKSTDDGTGGLLLLGPGPATVKLKPQSRDLNRELTQFYLEASNLFIPAPGVVDGLHHLRIRTSRGRVSTLEVTVPQGLMVGAVSGPVGAWQFDAESGRLALTIEPPQAESFEITVETQRSLDPLPVAVDLAPLRIQDAAGEVGLLAIAFGNEAQPEQITANNMSPVNLGDFDPKLIENKQAVLHRVYRYGEEACSIRVAAGPVAAEVRVTSKQVLSFGDERVVLAVNFAVEITRAGLFQLSFPLPEGLEVESLTGTALHHWSELDEQGQRRVILHLNGKTLGVHEFSLTLSGNAPSPSNFSAWSVPRFEIHQAARHTGELSIRPTAGIRLRSISRQNVSETDPRSIGGQAQGAIAFRLLQQDWNLVVAVEKLESWITGQVYHEAILREGQTRTVLQASLSVENASIRSLQVALPISDADVEKTLRATGDAVSDLVRTSADSNIWEIRLKRRVLGKLEFGLEYEKRGTRENDSEQFLPVGFPEVRQFTYHLAVRAGGRLELEHDPLADGWQRVDWDSVATALRQPAGLVAPVFTFRAVSPTEPLTIRAKRHSLAGALKLRITNVKLTTVLSPTGDQLTSVDTKIEVTQRSSLSVGLPGGGELFSIFVNGESVNSIRLDGLKPIWQFNILPGLDERSAELRFVYSVPGDGLMKLTLESPELNVPMENIQWDVIAPQGYRLSDQDGNLELTRQSLQEEYDRDSYLSKVQNRRRSQASQAEKLLEQANQLLQAGEQSKAQWAFNSVANQYALDAASNEDARVQLENLQTQQAVIGLNTRRQRLMLDNNPGDTELQMNAQARAAAAQNPILRDDLNYRPQQVSQLLQGNTSEDNAVLQQIAFRLVRHQHSGATAPQAIVLSVPEGGSVYTFVRSVQVAENAPLSLKLEFDQTSRLQIWQIALTLLLLFVLAIALVKTGAQRRAAVG